VRYGLSVAGVVLASGAQAQDLTLTPILDARLRWEHAEQDGIPKDANAVTARVRSGVNATLGDWSALIESEATLAIVPDYNDGANGKTRFAGVADPENVEINRIQVQRRWQGGSATVGRQLIELQDQRFVGSGSFRQNQQTFDAARVQTTLLPGVSVDVTYAWGDHRLVAAPRGDFRHGIGGDSVFALAGAATPIGTLTGFAYLIDVDDARVQGFRQSNQSYGARLAGNRKLGGGLTLSYAGSYAAQSDWHRNPNRYRADYYLAEASLGTAAVTATAGYEVLGAGRGPSRGATLASFQTPLSALFKFQGWADKFTITPPDGVRDLYGTLAATDKKRGLSATATYHRFTSDRDVRLYGDEWNLLAAAKVADVTYSIRLAHYVAKGFATDTDRVWLSADWAL
jgi:hypothetical protein